MQDVTALGLAKDIERLIRRMNKTFPVTIGIRTRHTSYTIEWQHITVMNMHDCSKVSIDMLDRDDWDKFTFRVSMIKDTDEYTGEDIQYIGDSFELRMPQPYHSIVFPWFLVESIDVCKCHEEGASYWKLYDAKDDKEEYFED